VRGGTSRKCPFVGNYSLKLRLPIIYPNSRRIEQRKRPILCDLLVCEGDSGGITHAFPLHALVGEKVGYNRVGERTMEAHCEYLSTDDLVLRAQQGDERAAEQVLALFRPLAQNLAGRFYMPSCDPEDVYQVALIGLWRAVQCFDPQRKAGFAAFARVCIRRQILSELKRAQRWAAPIISLSEEGDGQAWLEQLPDPRQNLYEQLSERETTRQQREFLATKLSPLERK
jgi:RNA polymerase sporulation-specific sigma factor